MRTLLVSTLLLALGATATQARAETWAFAVVEGELAPKTVQKVRKRLAGKGRKILDLTAEYRAIATPLGGSEIVTTPPGFLSAKLKADWESGMAACAERGFGGKDNRPLFAPGPIEDHEARGAATNRPRGRLVCGAQLASFFSSL